METPELHTSLLQRAVFFLFAGSLGYWAGLTGASSVRIDDADDAKDSEASGKEDAAPSGAVVVDGVRMVHHADRSGGYAVRQVGPFTLQNTAYTRSIMWNIVVLGFVRCELRTMWRAARMRSDGWCGCGGGGGDANRRRRLCAAASAAAAAAARVGSRCMCIVFCHDLVLLIN